MQIKEHQIWLCLGDLIKSFTAVCRAFFVGRQRRMFTGDFNPSPFHVVTNYDRDPRTGEFVVFTPHEGSTAALVVVLNWVEELTQRMAAK